jgi:hypothetical protein
MTGSIDLRFTEGAASSPAVLGSVICNLDSSGKCQRPKLEQAACHGAENLRK